MPYTHSQFTGIRMWGSLKGKDIILPALLMREVTLSLVSKECKVGRAGILVPYCTLQWDGPWFIPAAQ